MLFIIFLSIPILEIYLFIKISEYLGSLQTILLIVLTALIGSLLIKSKAIKTIYEMKRVGVADRNKFLELVGDGIYLFISGVLLITPGFITDLIGFTLFFKRPRKLLLKFLKKKFVNNYF